MKENKQNTRIEFSDDDLKQEHLKTCKGLVKYFKELRLKIKNGDPLEDNDLWFLDDLLVNEIKNWKKEIKYQEAN